MSNIHYYRGRDRDIIIVQKQSKKARWYNRISYTALGVIIVWSFVGLVWMASNF